MIKYDTTPSYGTNTECYYDTHAKTYMDSTVHLDLSDLYDRFLNELAPGSHILDAGCGSGRDTKAFLDRGHRVTAIDASRELAKLAEAFTSHHCEVLRFQNMEFREQFDGIWACASLLHIPKVEITEVIPRFIRALKQRGIFYVSLKEGEGERIAEDGRFVRNYTTTSFRELIDRFPTLQEIAFWKTEEIRSTTHFQPWLNFLLKKVQ